MYALDAREDYEIIIILSFLLYSENTILENVENMYS